MPELHLPLGNMNESFDEKSMMNDGTLMMDVVRETREQLPEDAFSHPTSRQFLTRKYPHISFDCDTFEALRKHMLTPNQTSALLAYGHREGMGVEEKARSGERRVNQVG